MYDTPLGPIGLLICWDLSFPEAFRELVAQGAKIIIVPTFCSPFIPERCRPTAKSMAIGSLTDCSEYGLRLNESSEKLFLESTLTARAFENTCAVVFVNAGGPKGATRPGTFAGLSRIAMPFIGARGAETLDTGEEGMSVVDIDMELLEEAEKHYKVREDLAREDWHYVYRHDSTARGT